MWSFCLLIVKWRDMTLVSWHFKKLVPPLWEILDPPLDSQANCCEYNSYTIVNSGLWISEKYPTPKTKGTVAKCCVCNL